MRLSVKRVLIYRDTKRQYKGINISAWRGLHEEVFARLRERLEPGSRIADLGAGEGAMTQRLLDEGYRPIAFDINPEGFVPPKEYLVRCDLSDPADTERIAVEFAGSFDGVIAIEIIEHLTDPWRMVGLAKAILKPGGWLFVTAPNVSNRYSRMLFLLKGKFMLFPFDASAIPGTLGPRTGHINPITEPELEYIFKHCGFKSVETLPAGHWPLFYARGVRGTIIWLSVMMITSLLPMGPLKNGLSYLKIGRKEA